jgi:HK97 gp10 family phage protein
MSGEAKAMAQLNAIAHIDVSKAQLDVLKAIYEESQRLVAVDTGELKDSGKYDENAVEYGTDHAVHIEFGTINMQAQPYLRPAVTSQESELARISAERIEKLEKEAI